jgi:beta-lactamase regulating signal transducer with metallopeptidase domain
MPKLLLEYIVYCLLQNVLLMAIAYILFSLAIGVLCKNAKAKWMYSGIVVILFVATVWFIYNLVQFGLAPKASKFPTIPLPIQVQPYWQWIGVAYIVLLLTKILLVILENAAVKKMQPMPLHMPPLLTYLETFCSFVGINMPSIKVSVQCTVAHVRGLIKQTIVLPFSYLTQLSEAELEAVILHELAHIKRFDALSNSILLVAEVLFYYNPFVKLLIKEARLQRELACDDWVMQHIAPMPYAQALQKASGINTKSHIAQLALQVPKHQLLYRIKRLFAMQSARAVHIHWKALACTTGLVLFLLASDVPTEKKLQQIANKKIVFANIAKVEKQAPAALVPVQKIAISEVKTVATEPKPVAAIQQTIIKDSGTIADAVAMVQVANEIPINPLVTFVTKKYERVGSWQVTLLDSTIIYQDGINKSSFDALISKDLSKLLTQIVYQPIPQQNMVVYAEPLQLVAAGEGGINLSYSKAELTAKCAFNQATNKWYIDFTIVNNGTKVASKMIDVEIDMPQTEISL